MKRATKRNRKPSLSSLENVMEIEQNKSTGKEMSFICSDRQGCVFEEPILHLLFLYVKLLRDILSVSLFPEKEKQRTKACKSKRSFFKEFFSDWSSFRQLLCVV